MNVYVLYMQLLVVELALNALTMIGNGHGMGAGDILCMYVSQDL